MANMSVNQRNQFERVELAVPTTGTVVRHRGYVIAFTVLALAVLATLILATVEVFEGWAHFVVLGAIIAVAVGAMIALSPRRRA